MPKSVLAQSYAPIQCTLEDKDGHRATFGNKVKINATRQQYIRGQLLMNALMGEETTLNQLEHSIPDGNVYYAPYGKGDDIYGESRFFWLIDGKYRSFPNGHNSDENWQFIDAVGVDDILLKTPK